MNATRAWTILVAGIGIYEYACIHTGHPEHLLSRGLDRARATHPVANIAVLATIAATAGHLARITPPRLDVFALLHIA
ncbi:DUF7427 family protein [Gordonia sp. (in: high G+C Gram-positive bacteria)]|uniref:DUF7427 family protein n=1 Tax=Gordonia sp. (in: high G+C Gram-positive bacteria) TaxID=84139 RepID=UPI003F956996